jgi:hypothetical protein
MSMDLMVKAMKTKVGNPLRKLVLVKLADNASDQGECWPSYQHIADQCEISRTTVKVHVRELEKAGFLRREYRRKGELNQSNLFHLELGSGAASAQPGAGDAPGGGASAAPRTSHSSEPVKEPKTLCESEVELVEAFEVFWKLYPNKRSKKDARKAWEKLKPGAELRLILMTALGNHRLSRDWTKDDGQFVPMASTWLNGERWTDVLKPASNSQSRHTNLDQINHEDGLEQQADGTYRIASVTP